MADLVIRDVPEDVFDRLTAIARRLGISIEQFTADVLVAAAARERNRELFSSLPDLPIDGDVVADIKAAREERAVRMEQLPGGRTDL